MDPANWLAPAGIAVLTATLLRRYRGRSRGAKAAPGAAAPAARDAVRETIGGWELRLHDAGREAEASLRTRAAELEALAGRAETAADRLRVVGVDDPPDPAVPARGDAAVRRFLRQAGYDAGQIDVLLARDGDDRRRAAA